MKKIAMFSMGTRGDIQPYLILSKELMNHGYDVVLGTHPCWKDLVESYGVNFVSVGPNISIEDEAAKIRGKSKNPMMSMLKTMNFVFKLIENSTTEIYECCKGKDLIIVSHSQMGATEAEVLGIKTINVTLQTEMIPEVKKEKTIKDKLIASIINPFMVKPYNKIRKKYNLKKVKSMDQVMSKDLNLIPISQMMQETNTYWDTKNKVVGYWFTDDEVFTPSKDLEEFLNKGDKPIILALGAMSFESKEEVDKLNCFIEAFTSTNKRAIIQGFKKSLKQLSLPETMLAIDSVPHSWLFKQGYAVIHHCGFGTSASSLIYGIPSICIPHVLDQVGFAQKLLKLNVTPNPILIGDLTKENLVQRINDLDENYRMYVGKCAHISKLIKEEDGLNRTIELIEQVIGK